MKYFTWEVAIRRMGFCVWVTLCSLLLIFPPTQSAFAAGPAINFTLNVTSRDDLTAEIFGHSNSDSATSGTLSDSAAGEHASGNVSVSLGLITAFAAADAFTDGFGNDGEGDTTIMVQWEDDLVITSPSITPGTVGELTFQIEFDGSLSGSALGGSGAESQASYDAFGPALSVMGRIDFLQGTPDNESGTQLLPTIFTGNLFFQYGVPEAFGVTLNVFAETSASGSSIEASTASSEVDMGSTVRWLGITEVRDDGGIPVATFSALGASGTDWSIAATAVPEPNTFVLGLISISALYLFRRRSPNNL